jgi:hypothetical protein
MRGGTIKPKTPTASTWIYGRFGGRVWGDQPEGYERIDRSLFEMFEWEDF